MYKLLPISQIYCFFHRNLLQMRENAIKKAGQQKSCPAREIYCVLQELEAIAYAEES